MTTKKNNGLSIKSAVKSKTVQSGLLLLFIGLAPYFGLDVPTELLMSVAGGWGLYGVRDAIEKKK